MSEIHQYKLRNGSSPAWYDEGTGPTPDAWHLDCVQPDHIWRTVYQQGYAAALAQTAGVPAVEAAVNAGLASYHGVKTFSSEVRLRSALEATARAMLATAPAASGVDTSTNEAWAARAQEKIVAMDNAGGEEDDMCPNCVTPWKCNGPHESTGGASVSERARAFLAAEYRTHGWHEDAGRLCMGGDPTSFVEDDALRVITRLIEQGDEDTHVITELGRLLASIAVILKGPEPAGTAWSYHDLPDMVQALTQQRGESNWPGMSYWAVQLPGKMPKLYGVRSIAELNWYPDEGAELIRLQEVERIDASKTGGGVDHG